MRRVGVGLLAFLAAFWWCGMDSSVGSAPGDVGATVMLTAITTGDFDRARPATVVPTAWSATMGYRPILVPGPRGETMLAKPTGDCSSFTGQTGYDFTPVCMEHDLAYDVVRYAARVGDPLPASARQAADDMFDRDLHARCDELGVTGWSKIMCNIYASGFATGVRMNSWRQGYRSPDPENTIRWWAMLLLALTLMCLPRAVRSVRTPDRMRRPDPFGLARTGTGPLPTRAPPPPLTVGGAAPR